MKTIFNKALNSWTEMHKAKKHSPAVSEPKQFYGKWKEYLQ